MYEELGSVREPVALSSREALDSAEALLMQQGYEVTQRTETSVTVIRRKREGLFRRSLRNLTFAVRPLSRHGVEIKLRGNDHEEVQVRQAEWSRWAENLPEGNQNQKERGHTAQEAPNPRSPEAQSEESSPKMGEGPEAGNVASRSAGDRKPPAATPTE